MKKILILSIAVMVITACSKSDDNSSNTIDHKIVGKWQHIAVIEDVGPFEWQTFSNGAIVQYKNNGIYKYDLSSGGNEDHYERRYTINNNERTLYFEDGTISGTSEFEIIANDTLIVYYLLHQEKYKRLSSQD